MAKRAARRAKLHAIDSARIHNVIFDHTPANDRDQSYIKKVRPRSDNQRVLMEAVKNSKPLTVALGPAGTGKTYLAIAKAVDALEAGRVARIVLSRPAVEAGESLGFLPGDVGEKLAPYLRPLYDALTERLGMKRLKTFLAEGTIEIAPVAYMRGRTLNDCFIVIDEAQNCTYGQIKMLLTRLGWRSTMVLTGDPDQTDLLPGLSGLRDIGDRLERVPNIAVVRWANPISCAIRWSAACCRCFKATELIHRSKRGSRTDQIGNKCRRQVDYSALTKKLNSSISQHD